MACIAAFDPEVPDYILRSSLDEFLDANAEGFSPEELDRLRWWGEKVALPGDALSIPSGGGCFFVVVYEGSGGWCGAQGWNPDAYHVAYQDGQYFGIHNGRPEPIDWSPLS